MGIFCRYFWMCSYHFTECLFIHLILAAKQIVTIHPCSIFTVQTDVQLNRYGKLVKEEEKYNVGKND